jgi:hypothetical protein
VIGDVTQVIIAWVVVTRFVAAAAATITIIIIIIIILGQGNILLATHFKKVNRKTKDALGGWC